MDITKSPYYNLAHVTDLDEICRGVIGWFNTSKFVINNTLNSIKDMDGKNYSYQEDIESIITPDVNVEILSSKSIVRSLSDFCNNKIVPLNYVKTMIILLMHNGFMMNHYKLLNLREDLYAYDEVKMIDLITNYYETLGDKLSSLYNEMIAKYPAIRDEYNKDIYYFVQSQPDKINKLVKNSSTIVMYFKEKFTDEELEDIKNYTDQMRETKHLMNEAVIKDCEDLFQLKDNQWKAFKDRALKVFEGFITTREFKKILENKYLTDSKES